MRGSHSTQVYQPSSLQRTTPSRVLETRWDFLFHQRTQNHNYSEEFRINGIKRKTFKPPIDIVSHAWLTTLGCHVITDSNSHTAVCYHKTFPAVDEIFQDLFVHVILWFDIYAEISSMSDEIGRSKAEFSKRF